MVPMFAAPIRRSPIIAIAPPETPELLKEKVELLMMDILPPASTEIAPPKPTVADELLENVQLLIDAIVPFAATKMAPPSLSGTSKPLAKPLVNVTLLKLSRPPESICRNLKLGEAKLLVMVPF